MKDSVIPVSSVVGILVFMILARRSLLPPVKESNKRKGRDVAVPPFGLMFGILLEISLSVGAESADALGFLPMPLQWRVVPGGSVRAAVARGLPYRARAIRGGVRWGPGGCG